MVLRRISQTIQSQLFYGFYLVNIIMNDKSTINKSFKKTRMKRG